MDFIQKVTEEISEMFDAGSFDNLIGIVSINENTYPSENEVRNVILFLNVEKGIFIPTDLDRNIQFWLERISMAGKLKLYYIDEAGRKKTIDKAEFLKIYTSRELPESLAPWAIGGKPGDLTISMTRDYKGYNGQMLRKILIADITEPKKEYKDAVKGLKVLGY